MNVQIADSWKEQLKDEFEKNYFVSLVHFIKEEKKQYTIYPPGKLIFNAFAQCAFDDVKVVILGQDPYHGPGQANGLSFSVNDGVMKPPSLINIFKEIEADLGKPIPQSGNLERWAKQGVLLLNATLTVRAASAGSHQNKGWEEFTSAVVSKLSAGRQNLVFMLWGSYAQKKGLLVNPQQHKILKSPHPSPLSASRGFFGNKHFSQANDFLVSKGLQPIHW